MPTDYTNEILDSVRSLRRFVSLVQWKLVEPSYRPMRVTKDLGGPRMELRSTTSGAVLDENQWLWTGASDGTITVGWIVRNYPQNYYVPELDDGTTPVLAPKVNIYGLTQGISLELAWFDDHKGQLIGQRLVTTTGQFTNVLVPSTEPGGFWKSIAFLIQPVGFTPSTNFQGLPDQRIGQILIDQAHRFSWSDEGPWAYSGPITFTAVTKPPISDPWNYRFDWEWYFGDPPQLTRVMPDGGDHVTQTFTPPGDCDWWKVKVDIKERNQPYKRVSGDIIYVFIRP